MDELFLESESLIFDNDLSNSSVELIESCASFIESCNDLTYITEKHKESLIDSIKKFIADIISSLQNLKNSIKIKIQDLSRSVSFQVKLKKFQKELVEKKSEGVRKVEIVDVEELTSSYCDMVNDLRKTVTKISKMKYRNSSALEKDFDKFHSIVEAYDEELSGIMAKKVKLPIDVVLKFVDNEIKGESDVLKTLNDSMTLFKQMEADVTLIETRDKILGPDLITKHVGIIRRTCNRFSSFVKKWVVKIISTVVFLFA